MSRFRKLSQTIWHCQCHIAWTPKYRYRVLKDKITDLVTYCIRAYSDKLKSEVVELNVQIDHVHLISMVPPKLSISDYLGTVKGRTSIRVLNTYRYLREKPYWGNHFWSKGYCVDTVGLDAEMIRKYVKHQEEKERRDEQVQLKLF